MDSIEGFFVVTDDDLIFEVKGVIHPRDRIIAYLRYVPDMHGNRRSGVGTPYRKIYNLKARELFLGDHAPQYIWYDKVMGRSLQAVPQDHIAYVLNPVDGLRHLRDIKHHVNDTQRAICDMSESIVEMCGISWTDIGVTGSHLCGLDTPESDIDLVVYGTEAGKRVYKGIQTCFSSLADFQRYSGETLNRHVNIRWSGHNQHKSALLSIEARKLLQGTFRGVDFFIRIVKRPHEMGHQYGETMFRGCGTVTTVCQILDDSEAFYTPCYYRVVSKEIADLQTVTSYRGRFTEHGKIGMTMEVCGRLEVVNTQSQGEYKQIVLGEDIGDYMIPV
jgi:predicted nucleotidyltransferase